MATSRRHFLSTASLGLLGAVATGSGEARSCPHRAYMSDAHPPSKGTELVQNLAENSVKPNSGDENPAEQQPGQPPTFGTGPAVGPEVSPTTFVEAEKLVQVEFSSERDLAAWSWRRNLPSLYERRTGPRKVALEATLAPATCWNPVLPGQTASLERDRFIRSNNDPGPLPARDEDIAFASVTQLSRWIEHKKHGMSFWVNS